MKVPLFLWKKLDNKMPTIDNSKFFQAQIFYELIHKFSCLRFCEVLLYF